MAQAGGACGDHPRKVSFLTYRLSRKPPASSSLRIFARTVAPRCLPTSLPMRTTTHRPRSGSVGVCCGPAWRRLALFDQAAAQCMGDRRGAACDAELGVDVFEVGADCGWRDRESRTELGSRESLARKAENLEFASGEWR